MCSPKLFGFTIFLFYCLTSIPVLGTVVQLGSGLSSAGNTVNFKAELTITGDILVIELSNLSPQPSKAPNDLLCSYFFDIVDSANNRPVLAYISAVGDVYLAKKNSPDELAQTDADIKADNAANTWEFLPFDSGLRPFLGFGIGTVGNNNLTPNNFHGSLVNGMDYSIYTGDVTTSNLNNRYFVKDTAVFTFSGLAGFSEADIRPSFAFGLGTAPDSLLNPEPATIALLALGSLALLRKRTA